jgi:uncharacterized protein YndB with AHSA1/START domain
MAHGTRGYAHRVDIRAEIADVWQALIDPARLTRWYGPQARVDAREGGSYWIRIDDELTREAHIDVYQAPRRLRLIYMPQAGLPTDDAVMVDDFLLHSEIAPAGKSGSLTILRLLGSGIPEGGAWDPWFLRLRGGWERWLLRLKVLLEPAPAKKSAADGKPPPKREI